MTISEMLGESEDFYEDFHRQQREEFTRYRRDIDEQRLREWNGREDGDELLFEY